MADIQVANTDSDLSGNTVITEENAYTITGLHTFDRDPNAPFAVASGSAVVANLDADLLDGQEGAYYLAAANATGTLAVNRGGTGAATFTDGGVLLGSGTSAITAMAVLSDGQMIVGNGSTDPVAESGATLRTSIGVGTGDSPQFTAIELGAASDTTLARASAGNVNIEGNLVYRAGGTDVPVADGGTGASTFTDGGVLLGSGTDAITATAVLGDGVILIGDASGDPTTLDVGSSSGITILGTIATGTWQGTAVADTYVANDLTISGGTVDNSVIGGSTAAAGSFTSLGASAALTVAGTGPHAIGGSVIDYARLSLVGAFTSGGASTAAFGTYVGGAITGHAGDSAGISGTRLDNSVVTAGNATTVAQLSVNEPQITVGSGTVTNSASIYVSAAATEATNDYALWVDSGATQLDGSLTVDGDLNVDSGGLFVESDNGYVGMGTTSPASALHVTTTVAAAVNNHMKGVQLSPSVTGYPGWEVYGIACYPTMVESGSGVHGNVVGLLVQPTITNGVGTTTTVSSVLIQALACPSTTGTGAGLKVNATTGASTNRALHTVGDAYVQGALSKSSGSFKIDHPLPSKTDTNFLVHSFIEGPRADLLYRGSVTLADGTATIDLDAAAGITTGTWVSLCRDEQVFTTNETGWHHVRGTVSGSTLTIDCEEACDDVVSWMVVAERQDMHIKATSWTDEDGRPILEPAKPPEPEENE